MKRLFPIILSTAALLFFATGCEPVAATDDEIFAPEASAITSFSFKSIISTSEFIGPDAEMENETDIARFSESEIEQLPADSDNQEPEIMVPEYWDIIVYVPQDTDVTCLYPMVSFEGETISPEPLSVQDYTDPVQFTVTAEDPQVPPRVYTVTVKQLKTASDWMFKAESFDLFASEVSHLEAGEYRVSFPAKTTISPQDIYLIRDTLGKKEHQNKLFRLDFTGCIFEDNTLPQYAFTQPSKGRGISNLVSVTLPEGLEVIEAFAFEHDKNLFAVSLPKSLKSIGEEAFLGCTQLKSVRIRKGVDLLGAWVFGNFTKEQSIIMDVSEAPETWAPTWNYKCRAVIEWADPDEEEPVEDIQPENSIVE